MDYIRIGAIVKPQGIKGELKIKLEADDFSQIENIKSIKIDGIDYKLAHMRNCGGDVYVKLCGVDDRNAAELLRGKEITALKSSVKKAEGCYFIADIIGFGVYLSDGSYIGDVNDIVKSNVDMYYVGGQKNCVFPLLVTLQPIFDEQNRKLILDKEAFSEVALYED